MRFVGLLIPFLAVVLGSEASLAQERQTTDYLEKTPTAEELIEALLPEKPEAIQIRALEREVQLKITFAFDSAELVPDSLAVLDNLAEAMDDPLLADLTMLVEGHTDSVGSDVYNKRLSERRAEAVRAYLVSAHGIPPVRLRTEGLGEARPLAGEQPESSRNRRVNIVTQINP